MNEHEFTRGQMVQRRSNTYCKGVVLGRFRDVDSGLLTYKVCFENGNATLCEDVELCVAEEKE